MSTRSLIVLLVGVLGTTNALAHIGGFRVGGGFRAGGGYHFFTPSYSAPHYSLPSYYHAPVSSFGGWRGGYIPSSPYRSFSGYNRPAYTGGIGNRMNFNIGNRTANIGNRTRVITGGIGNRTNINTGNIGNRTTNISYRNRIVTGGIGNRTYINTGGIHVNNLSVSNTNIINRNALYNRPWGHYYPWYRGGWGGWRYWPSFWAGTTWGYGLGLATGVAVADGASVALSAPVGPTLVYDNPYYVAPPAPTGPTVIENNTYVVPPELDYSKPIQVPTAQQVEQTDEDIVKAATNDLDAARSAFKKGNYTEAIQWCDKGIHLLPGDTNLHEFRALAQFALGKYQDAAGGLYAVLAAGPGWDWNTLVSFYGDAGTYTRQLRALEAFVKANPKDPGARFVLSYHYLAMNYRDAALQELQVVQKQQPDDKVTAGLVDALTKDLDSRKES